MQTKNQNILKEVLKDASIHRNDEDTGLDEVV